MKRSLEDLSEVNEILQNMNDFTLIRLRNIINSKQYKFDFVNIFTEEIITNILENLSLGDLLSCKMVCRSWRLVISGSQALTQHQACDSCNYFLEFKSLDSFNVLEFNVECCAVNASKDTFVTYFDEKLEFYSFNTLKKVSEIKNIKNLKYIAYNGYTNSEIDGLLGILKDGSVMPIINLEGKRARKMMPEAPDVVAFYENTAVFVSERHAQALILGDMSGGKRKAAIVEVDEENSSWNSVENLPRCENTFVLHDYHRAFVWNCGKDDFKKRFSTRALVSTCLPKHIPHIFDWRKTSQAATVVAIAERDGAVVSTSFIDSEERKIIGLSCLFFVVFEDEHLIIFNKFGKLLYKKPRLADFVRCQVGKKWIMVEYKKKIQVFKF